MTVKKRELQYVIDGYVGSKFNKAFSSVERRMQSLNKVGNTLTKGVTLPLIAAGAAAIHYSNKMNEGMANVASLIPGNVARVKELRTGIQELAIDTGKATDDLVSGAYQVISAFGDSGDTLRQLEINTKAAVAGVAETTDAINLTSAVTKAYGDTSAEAVQKVADLALLTVRMGQTTFPELASSIGRVTPLTKGLGVAQEELFGVMATATGVTGGAAEVSTQLRGVLQSLMAPSKEMTSLMEKYGYANGQAVIEAHGLQGAIELITREAQQSGLPLQRYIRSIEGQVLAMALAGAQSDDLTTKIAAMENAVGATDAAYREQTEGINAFGHQLSQLQRLGEVTAQRLGDGMVPALLSAGEAAKPFLEFIANAAKRFSEADPKVQRMILLILGLAAAAGPAIKMIVGLVAVVGFLAKAFVVVKAALLAAFVATPIGWVVAAIVALIAGVYLLVKHWDLVKERLAAAWSWLVKFGTEGYGRLIPIVGIVATVAKNWDLITNAVKKAYDWIKRALGVLRDVGKALAAGSPVGRIIGAVGRVVARAEGGPVAAGRPYLVGERGPELFTPTRSGSIIPNLGLAGGGDITVNLTVNVPGGGGRDVQTAIRAGADYVEERLRRLQRDQERRSFA